MTKRMLIDATHPEETRVAVISGNRLEEFDTESPERRQLKGNIYLAKITRVEPSLQAAFVDYGGNRHGFLPFSEIHPDYYRIPIADREALLAEEAAIKAGMADAEDDEEAGLENGNEVEIVESEEADELQSDSDGDDDEEAAEDEEFVVSEAAADDPLDALVEPESEKEDASLETVGGDEVEDAARRRARLLRKYKIQEVIKRRQVILVQVTKEERGTKGAALTTYISLAGRYCVLMPNTARGGGISRKISSATDRRRLKSILGDLKLPEGVAVIVRTAGSQRSKAEIRRDYEYLLRLWNDIRETTLRSTAPALVHEEGNLIKRSIRDLYSREMEEIEVEGEEGYKTAKAFMKQLMPSHARRVLLYKDERLPLFHRYKVEDQLDSIHRPTVQLPSGGYLVINPTEALVSVDVNSGRATRERHIEETALKTNLEAADEVARQLRLRDLAGLVVIDFIDMEEPRHNREVERRLKDAMREDRARIQLGRISPFGLLELSRQRLRPSLLESSTETCPRCSGVGRIRTVDSSALLLLRALEEDAIRRGDAGNVIIKVPTAVAIYLMNRKREHLAELERRYGFKTLIEVDDSLYPPEFQIRRGETEAGEREGAAQAVSEEATPREREEGGRRRDRRSRRRDEDRAARTARSAEPAEAAAAEEQAGETEERDERRERSAEGGEEGKPKRRRRGRRGGRRRSRRRSEEMATEEQRAEAPASGESGDVSFDSNREGAEAEAPAEQRAEPETEKPPKPKRGRGRRKSSEPKSEASAADTTVSDQDEVSAAAEEKPKEKPKRRAASRRKAPAAAAAAASVAETAEAKPDRAKKRSRNRKAQAPNGGGEDSGKTDQGGPPQSGPEVAVVKVDEAEQRPKRRGWWNRLGL